MLASVSLLAYSGSWPRSWLRRVGATCAAVVLFVGVATLAVCLLKWRFGIDRPLVSDAVSEHAPYPGRPAANAAVGFVLLGAGLLVWDVRVRWCWATSVLSWIAAVVGLLVLTGSAIGAEWLVSFDVHQRIALTAAIVLCVGPVSIVLARPDCGATAVRVGGGAGGVVLRRLLSAAIALPVLLAAARFAGPRSGLFSERFGVWLFASAVAVTLVVVLWRVAVALERAGDQRSQFEGMMLALAQTASGGIVGADRDGQIVCANAAMFACEHGALDGQASEVVFCGADRGREHERLDRLLAGGERSTAVWVAAMSRCSLG